MRVRCRCCEHIFIGDPKLVLENMPGGAQAFLTLEQTECEQGEQLEVFQCPYCGLIQLTSEPVEYYKSVIRATGISEELKKFRRIQFDNFLEDYGLREKKIIEIGAGSGGNMEIMASVGADVYGVEYGDKTAEEALRKGLRVFRDFPESDDHLISGAPYDAFYTLNFMEHVPRPGEFIRCIGYNLAPGGVGLVEVPNADKILREHMFTEFINDHLSYFTEGSLRFLLEANGFEVERIESIWQDYILSARVRKRKLLDFSEMEVQKDRLQNSFAAFFEARKGKRIAAWGAGHQALAAIALAGAGARLECIIDSAPFKQGLYTPATHILIEPPERLDRRDIDTVIITAAGYSQEIADVLHRSYPWVETAVLCGNEIVNTEKIF